MMMTRLREERMTMMISMHSSAEQMMTTICGRGTHFNFQTFFFKATAKKKQMSDWYNVFLRDQENTLDLSIKF